MTETLKELRLKALVPEKLPRPEIRPIVPLTSDYDAYLVRELKEAPWVRMTRQEIEEKFPGVFDK